MDKKNNIAKSKYKLIILDRDGVINQNKTGYVKTVDEWIPIPNSLEAIAKAYKHGYKFAVATNQSGIARKYYTFDDLTQMHNKMNKLLSGLGAKFEYIAYCPHLPELKCPCRKPEPGLIKEIHEHTQIPYNEIIMIGDRLKDLRAAITMGADAALVLTGQGKNELKEHPELKTNGTKIYDNLEQCLNNLLY
jgi:D-glycero-D-manno-heptose 1,7-bisphosphate phosphatase